MSSNLNVRDTLDLTKVSDDFFRELLEIWGEINFENQITSENHLLDQPLWYNTLIRVDDKPGFFKEWFAKGITKVRHLLRMGTNTFLSLNDFCQRYNLKACPLSSCGIISAIKSLRNANLPSENDNIQERVRSSTRLLKNKKGSSLAYKKLVSDKSETPKKSQEKWVTDCKLACSESINWNSAYCVAKRCTKSTKLVEFHFKFFHRRVPTNDFLTKIWFQDNDNCTFCLDTSESLIHLFWSCHITSSFWKDIFHWLKNVHLISVDYTASISTALGLRQDTSKFALQVNYCLLLARYHIWHAKTKAIHPNLIRYLHLLKSRYELETQSGDTRKWEPLVGHL